MMEASSPLAAMQPTSAFMAHGGFHLDAPRSYASFAAAKNMRPNSFNFKDLSMKKSQPDYFSMKSVRGSSPTASLAADLSQNFHIDQSPQLATPRRALFANNFFNAASGRVSLTTPPIPSSSPGPQSDGMDISPLPHKMPFGANHHMDLLSPTPELTPAESSLLSMPSPHVSDLLHTDTPTIILPHERRRSGPLRPGFARTKGASTSSIPQKPSPESTLPPFQFGNGLRSHTASTLSMSEIFVESPPQEKAAARHLPVLPPARMRPTFGVTSTLRNGSPVGGHIRKNSNPAVRPRKLFRRSLSMFEHPEDVMHQEMCVSTLPPIMDMEPAHVPQLPHFVSEEQAGDLPRITKETLIDVLGGKFNHAYEKLVIIDCRFEYEYEGGHIETAVNFNDKETLASQLFDHEATKGVAAPHRRLLIFHCEYSAHRAPIMARFIRSKDRSINAENYPGLTYPEAYILDGGYSSFFKDYRSRCYPQNYVEMDAKEHARACEMGLGRVKQQRSKMLRAHTFAFGQHSPSMDSSPTAGMRGCRDTDVEMDLGSDIAPAPLSGSHIDYIRGLPRRMASQ